MKQGSTYESLEIGLRACINAVMMYYDVDASNNRFVDILDKIVNDIKQEKQR